MDFTIFGRVRVRIAGEWRDDWAHKKERNILGVLLLRPGDAMSRGRLVEYLCGPDENGNETTKRLTENFARVRKVLVEIGYDVPRVTEGLYRVAVDRSQVDYHVAQELLKKARESAHRSDHLQACESLDEFFALVRGEPLAELRTPMAQWIRDWFETRVLRSAYELKVTSLLTLERHDEALKLLDDIEPTYAWDLGLAKARIDALRQAGQHEEAGGYHLSFRKKLLSEGLDDEAEELRGYFNRGRIPEPRPKEEPEAEPAQQQATGGPHSNLPPDLWDFSGRDDLVRRIDSDTNDGSRPGVVLLHGAGGIGKTALAVHWANRHSDEFERIVYLNLNGFSRDARVDSLGAARQLLQALGTQLNVIKNEDALFSQLASVLNGRKTLLVLDNVAEPDQIAPILDLASDSLVVVTSRNRLDRLAVRYAARTIRVDTIATEVARQWLRRSIRRPHEGHGPALDDLVAACGGIPLALRIVGIYCESRPEIPLAEIAAELNERRSVLSVGDSLDDPECNVKASFELSYRALPPTARRMFRLLALHPVADIHVDVATALIGLSHEESRAALDVLHGSNLIRLRSGQRCQLHDLMHEYAHECLDADEEPEERSRALRRMLDWYTETAANAYRAIEPGKLELLGLPELPIDPSVVPKEFADDRAALRWAEHEKQAIVATIRVAHEEGFHEHAWRTANTVAAHHFKRHGAFREAIICVETGLRSANSIQSRLGEALSLNNLGFVCMAMHDFESAYHYFGQAHLLCREINHRQGTATSLHNMAYQRFRQRDFSAAERLYNEALKFERQHDLRYVQTGTLQKLGQLHSARKDYAQAQILYQEALGLSSQTGNLQERGSVLSSIAQLYLDRGDARAAAEFGEKALASYVRAEDRAMIGETCCILSLTYHKLGKYSHSVELAREAVRVSWDTGDPEAGARAYEAVALSLSRLGRQDAALEGRQRAAELARGIGV